MILPTGGRPVGWAETSLDLLKLHYFAISALSFSMLSSVHLVNVSGAGPPGWWEGLGSAGIIDRPGADRVVTTVCLIWSHS